VPSPIHPEPHIFTPFPFLLYPQNTHTNSLKIHLRAIYISRLRSTSFQQVIPASQHPTPSSRSIPYNYLYYFQTNHHTVSTSH